MFISYFFNVKSEITHIYFDEPKFLFVYIKYPKNNFRNNLH